MKLQDILFTQGFGTRHDCQVLVESGAITVDGRVCDDIYEEFTPEGLRFTFRDQEWPVYEKAVIAMNKPVGYECSMKPSAHPSIMNLLPSQLRKRNMQPVGRLDVDTTGVLIFTDDGALQHRLIHPKRHVAKVYEVTCRHPITQKMCDKLVSGVVLDDSPKPVKADSAVMVDEHHLRLTLTQGKYHQVKRMVAACSNRVDALHRSAFGHYVLPESLPVGQWVWIEKKDLLG